MVTVAETWARWISGGENRSTIKDFYAAGAEDSSRDEAFEFTNGEPPALLGNNEGANPVEFLLHALAGCVTTTTVGAERIGNVPAAFEELQRIQAAAGIVREGMNREARMHARDVAG